MTKSRRSRLTIAIVLVAGVAALAAATLVLLPSNTSAPHGVTVYETPLPMADFTLIDQSGKRFTFSSTRGKVVIMTFLFTHCGDVCPFSAIKLRQVQELLGPRATSVELVVIDTDPERDTVPVIADYSKELGLFNRWHMVTGSLEEMKQLYSSLRITVLKTDEEELDAAAPEGAPELSLESPDSPLFGLTQEQVDDGARVAKKFMGGYQIAHSAPFWIIDTEGRVRSSLEVSARPSDLAEVVKTYLKN